MVAPAQSSSAARTVAVALPIVIVAGCLISLLSFGPRSIMGLFLAPMTEARGWSREIFALSIALQNIVWGIGQPIAGAIADRYGSRRVLAGGGVVYAAGLALMAWAPDPLWLNVSAGLMVGTGMAAGSFTIVLAAFGRRVPPEKRSIVFGIGTAAGSMGQFVFAPFGQALIQNFGWSQALLVLAVATMAIPMLSIALAGKPGAEGQAIREQTFGQALSEAFSHRSYLLLTAGFFVCGFHVAFVTAHLPAFIVDRGLDPRIGAWSLALIGLFNVIGSLSAGYIGQHYSKPIFLSLIYLARAILIAAFVLLPVTPASVLIFLGVWLGGRLYDQTGSYDVVWWLGVALGIFAAIVHWPIKEAPANAAVMA